MLTLILVSTKSPHLQGAEFISVPALDLLNSQDKDPIWDPSSG